MKELLSAIIERIHLLDLKIAQLNFQLASLRTPPEDASTLDQSYASTRQAVEFVDEELRLLLNKTLP